MIRRIVKIIKNRALVTIPVCLFGFLLTYTNTVRAECNIADLDNSTAGVIQAYLAYYGRVPDAGGYEFWKMELENNGNDFSAISTIFGESKEFSDRFGDLDDAELVEQLYQWLFNR
ncbi:MAG: DUF4214 domain-containing protein, partial [Pseudomonadales bacterium]|nr:DUF4214 domain-containing protein [Pseudomonadales bacterium]